MFGFSKQLVTALRRNPLETKVVLGQVALYGLLFFSFNNKTFFPIVLAYSLYLFWILDDWREAVWLTVIAVLPLGWGLRTFAFDLPLPYNFETFTSKDQLVIYFSLTPRSLLLLFLILTLGFRKSFRRMPLEKVDLALVVFLVLAFISGLKAQHPFLSFIGFFQLFEVVVVYLLAKYYFFKKKKLFQLSLLGIFLVGTFEGAWASAQFLLKGPLGKILEESLQIFPYGKTTFENVFQYRSAGTFTDPITLAVFLSPLFVLALTQVLFKKPGVNRVVSLVSAVLSLLGIVFSFSRGAWAVAAITSCLLVIFLQKNNSLRTLNKKVIFGLSLLFLPFLPKILERMLTLQQALWSTQSSGEARLKLIQEAWAIIQQHPIWGVGLNNFLPAMAENQITDISTFFFFPVHNLYLLLLSETGLLATGAFLGFIFLSIRSGVGMILSRKMADFHTGIKIGLLAAVLLYLTEGLFYYRTAGIDLELFFLLIAGLQTIHGSNKTV